MDPHGGNTQKKRKTNNVDLQQGSGANGANRPSDLLRQEGDQTTTTRARTIEVVLPRCESQYTLHDFLESLRENDINEADIEAIGPHKSNNIWHICFFDSEIAIYVLTFESFTVKSKLAQMNPLQEEMYKLRVHWAPYWVPNDAITQKLEAENIRVYNEYHETYPDTNIRTMVRVFIIAAESPASVPYFISLEDGNEVFITMRNRAVICLRCRKTGHMSKQCDVQKSVAAPVVNDRPLNNEMEVGGGASESTPPGGVTERDKAPPPEMPYARPSKCDAQTMKTPVSPPKLNAKYENLKKADKKILEKYVMKRNPTITQDQAITFLCGASVEHIDKYYELALRLETFENAT